MGLIVLLSARVSAGAETSTQAGVAVSVEGQVKATTPPEKIAHSLENGDKIFMGDKIETGIEGQLQIKLLDETVFTLGPLSTVTIDEFVYDPQDAGGKSSMVKGIFRAVSGKVAQQKPEDVPDDFVADPGNNAAATRQDATTDSSPQAQEDALKSAELMDVKTSVNIPASQPTEKRRDYNS